MEDEKAIRDLIAKVAVLVERSAQHEKNHVALKTELKNLHDKLEKLSDEMDCQNTAIDPTDKSSLFGLSELQIKGLILWLLTVLVILYSTGMGLPKEGLAIIMHLLGILP